MIPVDGGYVMFYIGFRDVDHAAIGIARSPTASTIGSGTRPTRSSVPDQANGTTTPATSPSPFTTAKWLLWYNGRHGSLEQIGLVQHPGLDLGFKPEPK